MNGVDVRWRERLFWMMTVWDDGRNFDAIFQRWR